MRVKLLQDVRLYWNYAVHELKEGTEHIGDLARHLFENPPAEGAVEVLEADPEAKPSTPEAPAAPVAGAGDSDAGTAPEEPAGNVPPVDGTIDALMAWVDGDKDRAKTALEAEQAKDKPRSTVVKRLAALADVDDEQ